MAVYVDVAPELLRWAVERAGWGDELTEKRAPRLWNWIEGTHQPTLKQLEKFASDTHTPFGMLFLSEPPVEEIPIPDMRTVKNRLVTRPSADLLDTIYICQARQDWYRAHAEAQGFPAPSFVGTATVATQPEIVAAQMRQLLKFEPSVRAEFSSWENALRQLIDRIEELGVLVMISGVVGANTHRKLAPEEFRGFALSDPIAPLIFVNGADTKAAQIFTIVHELAHIWLGESALSDAAMLAKHGVREELWCNKVAAEMLVPILDIRSSYGGRVDRAELDRLAAKYRVSTLVILKRVHDAGFLSWDEYCKQYQEEKTRVMRILADRRGVEGGGNFYYTQPLRLSRRFTRSVISSAYDGSTTFREAYHLLGTKKHSTFEGLAAEVKVA